MYRVGRPFGGAIDSLLASVPEDRQEAGFGTADTPFGELPINNSIYTYGYEELKMRDLCDGYIVMGPVHEYETATPIPAFITEKNLEEAKKNFPAPKNRLPSTDDPEKAVAYLNDMIVRYADNVAKMLELFRF